MGYILDVITLVLLIVLLGAAGYLLYDNAPRETVSFDSYTREERPEGNYTSSIQFYPNMRFKREQIRYAIEPDCSDTKRASALEAFETIEGSTGLSFYASSDPEISVVCSRLPPEPERKRHFVAGEGGPTEILNGTLYSVILKGTFSLYRDETCDTPHIALHELLHVLGFDHNTNPQSILYPTLNCRQELDEYIITEINRLYAVPSHADLVIQSVEGNKSGKYLSFQIQIANQGLDDAVRTSLSVYADGEFIKEFELDTVPIAARKMLSVTNLNVGRRAQRIEFKVDEFDAVQELDEDNNQRELLLTTR